MKLESLLQYLTEYLGTEDHPDYSSAMNGLQVAGKEEVSHVVAAVDASEAALREAVEKGADLVIVHHGLFWAGLRPVTGRLHRKLRTLISADVGLYSCHLPLDGHAEVGNCALLGRALGLSLEGRFAEFEGTPIGWWGTVPDAVSAPGLAERVEATVAGPVHLIAGGPERIERVGVVTGGGGSFIAAAAEMGLDAIVTGEGSHHSYFDAVELGIHVIFAGHYATETFGVRALAEHLAERFGLTWDFVDQPTGL